MLRLSDEELPGGPLPTPSAPLQPEAAAGRLQAIVADFQLYHQDLRQRVAARLAADGRATFQPESIVLGYLDRYGEGLAGHPVGRDTTGRAEEVVDRTNNVIEQSFAVAKQGLRRRLGRTHLGRDLEDQPAQVTLAANLSIQTTCRWCATPGTNCPGPSPNWIVRHRSDRPAWNAPTGMRNCVAGTERGPNTPRREWSPSTQQNHPQICPRLQLAN